MFQKATKDPGVDWSDMMVSVKIEGGFSHKLSVVPTRFTSSSSPRRGCLRASLRGFVRGADRNRTDDPLLAKQVL